MQGCLYCRDSTVLMKPTICYCNCELHVNYIMTLAKHHSSLMLTLPCSKEHSSPNYECFLPLTCLSHSLSSTLLPMPSSHHFTEHHAINVPRDQYALLGSPTSLMQLLLPRSLHNVEKKQYNNLRQHLQCQHQCSLMK